MYFKEVQQRLCGILSGKKQGISLIWQHRLTRTIDHLRIYIIFIFSLITILFLSVLRDIKIETHLEDFLPQKHPFVKVQNQLTDIFGG